jgi:hypothetical protein
MTQPTYSAIRAAYASFLTAQTGIRATANRVSQVNPPMALILPVTGSVASYGRTMDGQANYMMRAVVLVSLADSTFGEDVLDAYLATDTPQSIQAAVAADPTLGGIAANAVVLEATGYGEMNIAGVDYLACSFVTEVFI